VENYISSGIYVPSIDIILSFELQPVYISLQHGNGKLFEVYS